MEKDVKNLNELGNESINEKQLMQKIEAALFLSANYLDVDQLVRVTNVNPLMVKEMVDKLMEKYNKEDSPVKKSPLVTL